MRILVNLFNIINVYLVNYSLENERFFSSGSIKLMFPEL